MIKKYKSSWVNLPPVPPSLKKAIMKDQKERKIKSAMWEIIEMYRQGWIANQIKK